MMLCGLTQLFAPLEPYPFLPPLPCCPSACSSVLADFPSLPKTACLRISPYPRRTHASIFRLPLFPKAPGVNVSFVAAALDGGPSFFSQPRLTTGLNDCLTALLFPLLLFALPVPVARLANAGILPATTCNPAAGPGNFTVQWPDLFSPLPAVRCAF